MIKIIVTGHLLYNKEFADEQSAYLFLLQVKQEHDDILRPRINHIVKPNPYYYHLIHAARTYPNGTNNQTNIQQNINGATGPSWDYQQKVRAITSAYTLKIEISHVEDSRITHLPEDEDYDLI